MISKYSVKKPFTVLVAVILVLVLGAVSVTRMTPDLLPKMSFPYIVLVTSYVGAALWRPWTISSRSTPFLRKTCPWCT